MSRPLQPTGKLVPVRPEVDTMMPGREGRLTSEQFERLAQVPFAVGAADFGKHTSLLGYPALFQGTPQRQRERCPPAGGVLPAPSPAQVRTQPMPHRDTADLPVAP